MADKTCSFLSDRWDCLERETMSDYVIYRAVEKDTISFFGLRPDFSSICIPLFFKEELFCSLDWGPFQRARENIVEHRPSDTPRWEEGWEEYRFTEKYSHPKSYSENCGGCSPWVLDSYSLQIMLGKVLKKNSGVMKVLLPASSMVQWPRAQPVWKIQLGK